MIDNVSPKKQKVGEHELTSEPTPSSPQTQSCSLDYLMCIPHHARLVLSFLSIPELLLLGCTSRRMRVIHQDAEISRRQKIWCQSVSRCFPETSTDDTDCELSDVGLKSNEDANLETLKEESDYHNILRKWCGGWPRLLHAREAGAPLPPIGPPLSTPCEDDAILLWDIRCDGVWKWSGTQPLDRNQPGYIHADNEMFQFHANPSWKKTLGDEIENIIWSGCASDHRNWEFSVSILSSQCSETLLHSHTIVPSNLVETIEAADGFRPTTDNLRLGNVEPDDQVNFCNGASEADPAVITPENDVEGIDDKGSICLIFQDFEFHVFSDQRQPGMRRIHIMWAYNANSALFSKMIVNQPPR